MEDTFTHIYQSPIGAIKITSQQHCIQEIIFTDRPELVTLSETMP